jgi:hypothetical protein
MAACGEQRGQRLTHGPVADDRDVGVEGIAQHLCLPQAASARSAASSWTTGFSMAPMPSTSTRTRSPGFSHGCDLVG